MKGKDIRKGKVIIYKSAPHLVLDFQHRTPGNLRAFVQATLRNIISGIQCETRFSSTEDIQLADVFTSEATYLFSDSMGHHFMNSTTYEEIILSNEMMGDRKLYLQDQMVVEIVTFEDKPIGANIPKTVELKVVETAPELKGATASNSPKPATLNTGLVVSVPPFVKIGDILVIDTESGAYLSRA